MTKQKEPFLLTAESYEPMGANYESAFGLDPGLQSFIEKAFTYFPPRAKVLDVGCGTGKAVARTVADHGHNVFGIDMVRSMVDLSRQQVPERNLEVASMLEYASTEEGKFDAVMNVLTLFLHSRAEMESTSRKWNDWLSPSGILCIAAIAAEDCDTSPDSYDEDQEFARGIAFRFMGKTVEFTLFTKTGWKDMLEQAGFEIAHTMSDVFSPPASAGSDQETHYFIVARKLTL